VKTTTKPIIKVDGAQYKIPKGTSQITATNLTFVTPCIIRTKMLATNKMQQLSFIDLFIDLFESAVHASGDKFDHFQEHF